MLSEVSIFKKKIGWEGGHEIELDAKISDNFPSFLIKTCNSMINKKQILIFIQKS